MNASRLVLRTAGTAACPASPPTAVAWGSDPGRAFLRATAALPRVILAFLLLALAAPALRAGTFSTAAWTDDATSGIASGQTTWAYHFGSTTAATVNDVTVTGIAAAPVSNDDFDLAAPTPAVFNNDTNNVTGPGSAVIARDFVYSNQAGGVMSVTVKGLTVGSTYTVSFLSVGWEAAGSRLLTFASGADSRSVDQGQFDDNNGIRIDYTFTATAATRLITLTPQNASFRFHLYGLALRPETAPTTVTTAADSGPGSLRWALVNAAERSGADTVTFAPALSGQTIRLTSGHLTLDSDVTIDASSPVTLSGGDGDFVQEAGESGIFYIPYGVTVILCRLNLINGMTGGGGAIYSLGQLTVDQCTISACRASFGGGIANAGTLNLTQSTLSGNSASIYGGGIYNNNGGTVTLTQSTLSGNAARSDGGGIYNTGGTLTFTQSTLSGNAARFDGGGICNAYGPVNLTQSTLSDNSAGEDGGGIYNAGALTLTQSTLSDNSASEDGGGIYNRTGTVTLTQSTLSGNAANIHGGGIYHDSGTLTCTQSTLAGNSASLGGGIFKPLGTLTLNRTLVAGNTADFSANISGSFSGSNNLTSGDPLLAPLGNYGGPTQTMPPLPGSPALDAGGAASSDPTDQRGAPRVADGDGNGTATVDIGAVEAIHALVTNANDSGAGSLRAALAASSTDIVLFDPPLSGQTITLITGQLTPSRSVGIDATGLAAGLTISGGSDGDDVLEAGESRLFDIPAGTALVLRGLNLINGIADPAMNDATGAGGAIRNSGQLTLDLCAISACRARFGGAINSTGVLTARRSTFQQNTATFGGAIHSADNGLLTMAQSTFLMNTAHDRGGAVLQNDADSPTGHPTFTRCTFHGNAAARGGAVNSFSLTNLLHCTLSGNSASGQGGGGVQASSSSVVTLTNCVVAGNNGASPDLGIEGTGTYTTAGVNLVGNLTGSGLSAGPTLLTGDPLLAPIADYGGPTPTRALLSGSPARNATTFGVDFADQRGFPLVGLRDLGAYEAGTLSDFDAFAIETPGAALSPTGDADNDGRSDLLEYATQSDPHASSAGETTPTTTSQNAAGAVTQANVTFPTRVGATDLIYTLQRNTTLTDMWTPVATWNATTGVLTQASGVSASRNPGTGLVSVADTNVSGEDGAFYRLDVQLGP